MSLLAPCPSCSRHVRVAETACPFCGASIALQAPSIRRMGAQHLGRAALFTFGTVAIATTGIGCGTATAPIDAAAADDVFYGSIGDVYGAPPHDAWLEPDAGHDAGLAAAYGAPPHDAAVEDAAIEDAGIGTHYGSPPVPPPPPEQP